MRSHGPRVFDAPVQAVWRAVQACVLARRGEHDLAEALTGEAVGFAFDTDDLWCRGDVHLWVSEVHARAGRGTRPLRWRGSR